MKDGTRWDRAKEGARERWLGSFFVKISLSLSIPIYLLSLYNISAITLERVMSMMIIQ